MLSKTSWHLVQRSYHESRIQDQTQASHRALRRPHHSQKTQAEMVRTYIKIIKSGQNRTTRHSFGKKRDRQEKRVDNMTEWTGLTISIALRKAGMLRTGGWNSRWHPNVIRTTVKVKVKVKLLTQKMLFKRKVLSKVHVFVVLLRTFLHSCFTTGPLRTIGCRISRDEMRAHCCTAPNFLL